MNKKTMGQTTTAWLARYLRKSPGKTTFVVVMSALEPIMYLIPLFLSADIVGVLVDGGGWSEVWTIFRYLIPLSIIQVIIFFLTAFFNEILAHRVTTDMTYDLFDELQSRSVSYHDTKAVGDLMARATNDTRAVNMGLSPGLRILIALFSVWAVGYYVIYTLLSPVLVLVGIISLVVFILLTFSYARELEPLSTSALEKLAELSNITTDSLGGIRDIKSYTAEQVFKMKFAKQAVRQAEVKEQEGVKGAWFYPSLLVRVYLAVIVGYSLFAVFTGLISIRDVVLIITVLSVLGGMADEMNWVSFIMVGSYAAMIRLNDYISEEDIYRIADGDTEFTTQNASVTFQNVSFSYPKSEQVILNDIDFHLEDSQTLAIVGSPGSGKTTLTKLIQRLYLPSQGRVLIGGIDVGRYKNSSLRRQVAAVEQDVSLFNISVLDNIRFGKPNADREEVIEIAKIAQAHEFIIEMPEGYDSIIGEEGIKLSGGQAQRVAIARALMMDPDILIFDDAASALDAHTEKLIQDAISDILSTRTTIITTHRLAIIAQADKILLLDRGEIQGFGTHEALIKSNLFYRNLFERHFELPPLEVSP